MFVPVGDEAGADDETVVVDSKSIASAVQVTTRSLRIYTIKVLSTNLLVIVVKMPVEEYHHTYNRMRSPPTTHYPHYP